MAKHSRTGAAWQKLRRSILERDAFTCVYCGDEATQVDHIVPVSKGGTDAVDNLVAACFTCNSIKSDNIEQRLNYFNKNYLTKL